MSGSSSSPASPQPAAPGDDQRQADLGSPHRCGEAPEVLAGLLGTHEQHERIGEQVSTTNPLHVGGVDVHDVDAEWDESQHVRVQSGDLAIAHRREARTDHAIGAALDDVERPAHRAGSVAGELLRIVHEGEIVHRHHEGSDRRRRHQPGGVGDVDLTDDGLDTRPVQPVPRFVQQRPRQRQHRNRPDRTELRHGHRRMAAGDEVEFDVVGATLELTGDSQGGDRRAPR